MRNCNVAEMRDVVRVAGVAVRHWHKRFCIANLGLHIMNYGPPPLYARSGRYRGCTPRTCGSACIITGTRTCTYGTGTRAIVRLERSQSFWKLVSNLSSFFLYSYPLGCYFLQCGPLSTFVGASTKNPIKLELLKVRWYFVSVGSESGDVNTGSVTNRSFIQRTVVLRGELQ